MSEHSAPTMTATYMPYMTSAATLRFPRSSWMAMNMNAKSPSRSTTRRTQATTNVDMPSCCTAPPWYMCTASITASTSAASPNAPATSSSTAKTFTPTGSLFSDSGVVSRRLYQRSCASFWAASRAASSWSAIIPRRGSGWARPLPGRPRRIWPGWRPARRFPWPCA